MNTFSTRSSVVPVVDLIYDEGCPNVDSARALLRSALAQLGLRAEWREWDRASPGTPPGFRGFGSPTILVDGIDVSGDDEPSQTEHGTHCRLYLNEDRLGGVPALGDIVAAFLRHDRSP
jgi:mercuric ion transport protein